MKQVLSTLIMIVLGCVVLAPAWAGPPNTFEPMPGYPAVSKSVVADVLGDGRFILYDGDHIFIENAADAGTFTEVASGYLGDPAFIAVAPDGHRCLVGAGEADWANPSDDWVWLFDATAPEDAPPVDGSGNVSDGLALITSAYAAVWLTDDLVLIDRAPGWVSELDVFDVSTLAYRKVVNKGGSSASVALGRFRGAGWVYATIGYGEGAGTTRRFYAQQLIDLFNDPGYDEGTSPLDWSDGVHVGAYPAFTLGVTGVTDGGTLILANHNSQLLYVHPLTGDVIAGPVNPTGGHSSTSVTGYYNAITNRILVTETNWAMSSFYGYLSDEYKELPGLVGMGLMVLAGVLGAVGCRRCNR